MKAVLVCAAGLLVGAGVSALVSGCGGCPSDQAYVTAAAGRYVVESSRTFPAVELDYEIAIATDQKTVTERFSRGGKRYVTTYEVTAMVNQ